MVFGFIRAYLREVSRMLSGGDPSEGSICTREYIRWLPDEPSEPTSTVVVTSPQNRYVDIRVLLSGKDRKNQLNSVAVGLERLDWAIAGVSSYKATQDDQGNKATHARWTHWIDSRAVDAEAASDEGDNYEKPDGTTLEKGTMVNPATGEETDYEEVWRDIRPRCPYSEIKTCVVLRVEDAAARVRGMVIQVGHICQGLLRVGEEMTAERCEFKSNVGLWCKTVRIGRHEMPCGMVVTDSRQATVGEVISIGELSWVVVEVGGA